MEMPRKYTDYLNETDLTIPDKFINVKTGGTEAVTSKIQEQIAYHAKNNTLMSSCFFCIASILAPSKTVQVNMASDQEILEELLNLKRLSSKWL